MPFQLRRPSYNPDPKDSAVNQTALQLSLGEIIVMTT